MQRPDFDVIVAGAGAGGAAAAYYLTQAGLRVLVVEKARLPRYKACGGAIPRPALERFPFSFESVIQAAPTHVRFTYPGLGAVDAPLPDRPVVMVMRSQFDAFLLARSGAEVLEETAVTAVTETEAGVRVQAGARTLSARYLVGADGAASTVARSLGLRAKRRFGGALEAEAPLVGNNALASEFSHRALFSLTTIPWGYAWVFPKDGYLSVGIGQVRPGRIDLHSALQREAQGLGIDLGGVQLHGHPVPCYRAKPWPWWSSQPQEPLSTRRCLLVGDAAGLVDPLLGEGIRHAMESARLAAEAIMREDLSGYETAIWREISHSLATAGLAAALFYRLPRQCFKVGVRNPATVGQFLDLLTGRVSYQGLARRLIGTTTRWLVQARRAGSE